jgi:pimeloyl-ACP methyl ester carboxylesterase
VTTTDERVLTAWRGQIQPRVHVAGDGPPLLYLHGAVGLVWEDFLESLAAQFTVYAPEHPGTTPGDPDGIKALDDLWDLTLYYYELLDQLELRSPAVVGHSFGGMVGAEIAATNPERVSKLVMISPIGLWRDDAPVVQYMTLTPDELAEVAFYEPDGPIAEMMLGLPEEEEAMKEAMIQFTWALACTGKFVWPLPDKGLKKRLHRITAPTLIVWGQQDKLAAPVYAEEFASRIPNARVELVDKAAHVPQLEQMDQVSRLVTEFLRS